MQLDFKWIDRRARDQWPVELSSVIEGQNYDVFMIGDTKHFQIIHRDDERAVCQTGQNTSQAVTVTFSSR